MGEGDAPPASVKRSGSPPSRGKRETENKAPYGPSGHFPQRGKIYRPKIFPPLGEVPAKPG